MTEVDAIQVIYGIVTDAALPVDVVYGIGKYTPASPAESWIRVSINWEGTGGHTIGTPARVKRLGRVFAQVFAIPPAGFDSAERAAMLLGQQVRELFELQSLPVNSDPVHFLEGAVRPVGVDGPHYHVNADVPFWFHDTAPT